MDLYGCGPYTGFKKYLMIGFHVLNWLILLISGPVVCAWLLLGWQYEWALFVFGGLFFLCMLSCTFYLIPLIVVGWLGGSEEEKRLLEQAQKYHQENSDIELNP